MRRATTTTDIIDEKSCEVAHCEEKSTQSVRGKRIDVRVGEGWGASRPVQGGGGGATPVKGWGEGGLHDT